MWPRCRRGCDPQSTDKTKNHEIVTFAILISLFYVYGVGNSASATFGSFIPDDEASPAAMASVQAALEEAERRRQTESPAIPLIKYFLHQARFPALVKYRLE